MLQAPSGKYLEDIYHGYLPIKDNLLGDEWWEKYIVEHHPVTEILLSHEVSDRGAKEDLYDRDMYLVIGAREGALGVIQYYRQRIRGSWKGKVGDNFPKRLVSNGCVTK